MEEGRGMHEFLIYYFSKKDLEQIFLLEAEGWVGGHDFWINIFFKKVTKLLKIFKS